MKHFKLGSEDSPRRASSMRPVQAVQRGARLMLLLLNSPDGQSLAELSKHLGVHKTTVLRLLRTLEGEGVLRRNPGTGRWELDPAVWLRATPATRPWCL